MKLQYTVLSWKDSYSKYTSEMGTGCLNQFPDLSRVRLGTGLLLNVSESSIEKISLENSVLLCHKPAVCALSYRGWVYDCEVYSWLST